MKTWGEVFLTMNIIKWLKMLGFDFLIFGLTLIPGVKAELKELERGWAYFRTRDYDKAILEFQKAINKHPELWEAYNGLGWSYYWKGEYLAAEEAFKKALERNPKDSSSLEGLNAIQKWRYADFNSAWNYFYNGDYSTALSIFKKVLEKQIQYLKEEDIWKVHSGLGWCYYYLKNYDRAKEEFEKILAINPGNSYALKGLGYVNFGLGKYDKAIEYFQKAIEKQKSWADCISMIGWSYYYKGDYKKAIEFFDKAIKTNPYINDPYFGIGWSNYKMANYKEAKQWFKKAVNVSPSHPSISDLFSVIDRKEDWWDLYSIIGWSYLKNKYYSYAENTFNYGIMKTPDDISLYVGLAFSYFRQGKYDKALDTIKYCISVKPNYPVSEERFYSPQTGVEYTIKNDLHSLLAWTYYYLKDYKNAEKMFKKSIKMHPDWASLYSGLGWVYYNKGEYKKAEKNFKKALELSPQFSDAINGLYSIKSIKYRDFNTAWSLYYSQDYISAISKFKELAEKLDKGTLDIEEEDKWKIYSGLGWSYLKIKDYDKALKSFEKVLLLSPENMYAKKGIALIYYYKGDNLNAIKEMEKYIEKYGEDSEVRLYLGLAYLNIDDPINAKPNLEKVISVDPSNKEALEGLVKCYHLLGDKEKEDIYKKALENLKKVNKLEVK